MPRAAFIMLSTALVIETLAGAQSPRPPAPASEPADHPPVTDGGGTCASCHAEVTSYPVMHGPTASGACDTCHVASAPSGHPTTFVLAHGARRGATRPLCVACHQEETSQTTGPHTHAPVASGDCIACHNPHGSRSRYLLPAEGNGACLTCHEDVAETLRQPFQHGPAVASCTMCHDAHAARFPFQLRATVNRVCLACHLEPGPDDVLPEPVALFGRTGARRTQVIGGGSRIPLDPTRRAGHPSLRHPVEGPTDPARKGRALSCTSCHNPHGGAHRTLLRFGATGVSPLCIRCHQL